MERLHSNGTASSSHYCCCFPHPHKPQQQQRNLFLKSSRRHAKHPLLQSIVAAAALHGPEAVHRGASSVATTSKTGAFRKASARGNVASLNAVTQQAQPPALPMASLQHLNLAYIQEVYQESWFYQSGTNPAYVQLNARILNRLKSYKSMKQVQKLVEIELPSMSGITIALVMLKSAIQLRPKTPDGRYYSLKLMVQRARSMPGAQDEETNESGVDDDGDNGSQPGSGSNRGKSPKQYRSKAARTEAKELQFPNAQQEQEQDWLQRAPPLVRSLLVHMAHLPANQVNLPSVAIALQSIGVTTEGNASLTPAEQAAVCALLDHVRPELFVASPKQLAQLAHGLCFVHTSPSKGWLKEFSKVVHSKLMLMDTHQIGFVAHAFGRQGCVPDEFWLSCFASETAPKLAHMKPRELSNTLWAVAQWQVDLGAEWREAACSAVVSNLHVLPTACLSSVLRSLQLICRRLPLTWLAAVVARLVDTVPESSFKQDCEVLAAFASLTYMPEQSSMAAYVAPMQPKLASASVSELVIALKALARLHFLPARSWLNDWVTAAHRHVRGFQAEETANTLACFATWGIKPPRDFTQDLFELTVAQARQGTFAPYFATRMLCALATLRLAPPRQVLHQLLQVLGSESIVRQNEEAGIKNSRDVGSGKLSSKGKGGSDLDARLMAAALANAFTSLPGLMCCYDPQQLASFAASTAGSVAVAQGEDGLDRGAASSGSSSSTDASNISPNTLTTSTGSRTGARSPDSTNQNLAEATAMLLPPSAVGPLLSVLSRRLHLLQGRHLCSVLSALVELKLYPGRGFLMAHVSAVAAQLPRLDAAEKRCLSAGYTELNGQ